MLEKISKYYPPWIEFIMIGMVIFAFYYAGLNYSSLPEMIPQHFGVSGVPDAWTKKSYWSVFILPVITAVVYLGMFFTNVFIIHCDDPRKVINIPKKRKEQLGTEGLEAIRIVSVRGLLLINFLCTAMLTYLSYASINTGLGLQKGLGPVMWFFLVALILSSIWLTLKVSTIQSK